MQRYIRAQGKGYTFQDMQQHVSTDGGDGLEEIGGICACSSIAELLDNTVITLDALEYDDDVVIFEGRALAEIYDGYRVEPIQEIARFKISDLTTRREEMEEYI